MSRRTCSRWIAALLVLGGTALHQASGDPGPPGPGEPGPLGPGARPSDSLRMSQNVPGDSHPIVVTADEICTWLEGRQRVFLFKGAVLIEHGVVQARMQQAVACVDLDRSKKTGITRLDVYGEADVSLENGAESKTGAKALFDLNTRGEVRFRNTRGKIAQQERKHDPLYHRAVGELWPKGPATAATAPPTVIQRTSYQLPDENAPVRGAPARPVQQSGPAPGGTAQPDTRQWIIPGQPPPTGPPPAGVVPPPYPPSVYPGPNVPGSPRAPGTNVPGSPEIPRQEAPAAPPAGAPASPPAPPADRQGPGGAPAPPERVRPPRQINMVPRNSATNNFDSRPLPNGEIAYIVKGGLIITVTNPTDRVSILDMEADQALVWMKGGLGDAFTKMRSSEGSSNQEIEFYLSGNVEIRSQDAKQTHTLRADEVYYDVNRNAAVAYQADLEFSFAPRAGSKVILEDPVHLRADEMLQISPDLFEANRAEVFSSRLPSDPGLKVYVRKGRLEQKQVTKRMFLGLGPPVRDPVTGQPQVETKRIFKGNHVFAKLEDIPVFYLPYIQGDVNDPLGPLEAINVNYNQMYGTQIFTTWNIYDLIGITPQPGTRWVLNADFMSKRGPALGTNYDYLGNSLFGIPSEYVGLFKAYGMYDKGFDLLGGNRGALLDHPPYRGRAFWHHNQQLPGDFYLQAQISGLSDKNFLEEFYYNEFNTAPNQETFVYLKQQRANWAWTFWTETRIRNWVDETQKLPAVDGYLLGESFPIFGELFGNRLTYNAHGSAGYYRLMTTHIPPPPVGLTNYATNTGRFDLWQDLSLPVSLGDLRLAPFGVIDLTQYTKNLYGESVGRFYGGGGLRGNLPFSRLFPKAQSELLNVNGIYHKVTLSGNYYVVHSNVAFTTLPQLDRLNDDATDQSLNDIKPLEPVYQPGPSGLLLANSTLYDPQVYAIRKLQLFNRVDTLDTMNVLQADVRQRWQTKRGYPGQQHIVDWMTLDVTASYFPQPGRSDFNAPFSLIQYYWIWNLGDRTALVADGWDDPMANGARVWSVGGYFNRPDRTSFYVGFRNYTPISSQLLTAAVSYVFSPKYGMTASSAYDFAFNQGLSNSLMFTRMGKDLQVSMGVTYNSILNNYGFLFEILPNAVAASGRRAAFASQSLASH